MFILDVGTEITSCLNQKVLFTVKELKQKPVYDPKAEQTSALLFRVWEML